MFADISGGIVVIMGIIFIVHAIWEKVTCTEVTEGKVIEFKEEYTDEEITYRPVFEYAVNEEKHIKESQCASIKKEYQIGDVIKIYYNKKNPDRSYEEKLSHLYIIFIGIVCIISGIGLMIKL